MQELEFIYMAFFLTVGAFLLGAIVSWNLRGIFDTWEEKADYAAVTTVSYTHLTLPTICSV